MSYNVVVKLLMDADATIKLHRSGVLARVVGGFSCMMPSAVYEEVVTRGKARLHEDARAIEGVIAGRVAVPQTQEREQPEAGLGAGEPGILELLDQGADAIVVSDDRRFLSLLSSRSIAFLTPADVLVLMARRGIVTRAEANEALERLRPMIRAWAYHEAREDLQPGGTP